METAIGGGTRAEKMKTVAAKQPSSLACIKFWVFVISTMLVILWFCTMQSATLDDGIMVPKSAFYFPYSFPPQRVYKSNGYLIISPNGGLNQKRLGISDMVAIARYLNVTLIVPKFAHGAYWNDTSEFADVFDVNHFITSLRDEVTILKELPQEQKRKLESEPLYYMFPMSFASLEYYHQRVLPRVQKRETLLLAQTDARLANNGLPKELQRLRCRVNYEALRFTPPIEETGRKIVDFLRQKGPFLALHLRYDKDVLAFTGCNEGLTDKEAAEMKQMRYSHDGWRHKPIDSKKKREIGSCPLTPEETALVLQALSIDNNTTIYIAAGEIYNKEKRMADLAAAYPNLFTKQTILKPEELEPFLGHTDQMAALDYIIAIKSDIFVPNFVGNMVNAVEGHRRYMGYKPTISPDRKLLSGLIDEYKNGTLTWDEFSFLVNKTHEDRRGKPARRTENPDHPRQEDYFYSNPYECLPPFA
ncbi:auxin transport protein BIG-like [Hibiscus syriacus]|uniref:O-fucosyltransferase family protein n=1 Tax=Hibiscus syriacus TaxID=106335 RepID=A0A6A3AZM1_HIBSY|nr:rhamnogalacturonan I rhamnosyltransferase 1-like [Hibiscus syriacus]KAE8710150.1 auxin transport protein BIG-like [Hibiscus syriacus]